ncbi:MAG: amidohydrolase [Tissierellia bacterium]|nr:amidohydrolase [Tissierellia bacterium]
MDTNELIKLRREFRQIAEVGWLEIQTTIKIIEYLKSLGYKVRYGKDIHSKNRLGVPPKEEYENYLKNIQLPNVDFDISEIKEGYTGCVAYMESKNPGPNIGMRVDIDALPLIESKDEDHLPTKLGFASKNEGFTHACGHDGHITIGLGVAKYIAENIDNLKGTYTLIFQPAEEGVRGASSMTEAGVVDHIDYLMGAHIGMNEKNGVLGVGTQNFLATAKYDVEFKGKMTHAAAAPELGKNALLGAASCALNLHTLPQFGKGMARLNVGVLNAGTGRNVVAANAKMLLEVRGDTSENAKLIEEKMKKVVEGSAMQYDLEYSMTKMGEAAAFNTKHPEFTDMIADEMKKRGFEIDLRPSLGASEDVSFMLKRVEENGGKCIHYLFGTQLSAPHHNEKFDYKEDVLDFGVKAFIETIDIFNKL